MFSLARDFTRTSTISVMCLMTLLITANQYHLSGGLFAILALAGFAALQVLHLLTLRRTCTELNAQTEAQQASIASLETRLAENEQALERSRTALEEKHAKLCQTERLSDLGHLTATVSHEIRNPLSVIRTAVHVIRKKAEAAGVDINRPLDRAKRAVGRCDDIVNDMLEYARSNELDREVVDSSQYLNDILDEQPMPANIKLVRELPEQGRDILIDRDRFRRAIINLVSNAVEAIKEGGIKDGLITVTCHPDCPQRSIHIYNNGPAIPQEVIDRMYEPLYTTKSNGSGIGLPTVKKLIEQHGAELHCKTGEGVGTTWTVLLEPNRPPVSMASPERLAA